MLVPGAAAGDAVRRARAAGAADWCRAGWTPGDCWLCLASARLLHQTPRLA